METVDILMHRKLQYTSVRENTVSMSFLRLTTIVSIALASSLRVVECASPGPDQVYPSDSGHSLVTKNAEHAKITALCHVACFNFLFEGVDPNEMASESPTTTNGTEVRLQY